MNTNSVHYSNNENSNQKPQQLNNNQETEQKK